MSSELNNYGDFGETGAYYHYKDLQMAYRQLETGFVVTIISPSKKLMNLMVRVIMETKEFICIKVQGAKPELTVNLSQVKDIRVGKKSADFDKCGADVHKLDNDLCLVLLYGTNFNLNTLSLQAKDEKMFNILHLGLTGLCEQIEDDNYLEQKDRWIWKQFHTVMKAEAYYAYCAGNTDAVNVSMKDVRGWFARTHYKIKNEETKEICKKLRLHNKLFTFNEFCLLFNEFLHPHKAIEKYFMEYMSSKPNQSRSEKRIGFEMFREFMDKEQNKECNPEETRRIMTEFLNDQHRSVTDLHFTEKEFIDFLFSTQNDIYDDSTITDDMTRPLSDYWIASSHNTYLTGDQIKSESSVEPYARCLRMGCRCVELDCWNGPDGKPCIYHGKTLTTKVKLVDVLQIIKENAFYSSEYPVILSIENHCDLAQQRIMAKMLIDIFEEMLITERLPNTENSLPSPEQLKHKILIKDKKLSDKDIVTKSGLLCKQDQKSKIWQSCYCELDEERLIISPPKVEEEDDEDEEEDIYDFPYEDVYIGDEDDLIAQIWCHGLLSSKEAESLISEFRPLLDGAFLVRENAHKGHTLSFWHNNKCNHCRIKNIDDKYCLNKEIKFDTIVEMIDFYQRSPVHLSETDSMVLTKPIPVPPDFLTEPWYHNTDRHGAENLLKRAKEDGTFLIRPSSIENRYSLSVVHDKTIRHFPIGKEGRLFTMGSDRFLRVTKLVDFFTKRPLAKHMKLKVPATSHLLDADNLTLESYIDCDIYNEDVYSTVENRNPCDSGSVIPERVSVRALYDYSGTDPSQLSFKRGAMITDVLEEDTPWWIGKHSGRTGEFPSNYVEIVENIEETGKDEAQETITLPLDQCVIELSGTPQGNRFAFKLYSTLSKCLILGTDKQEEFVNWFETLSSSIDQAHEKKKERKKVKEQNKRADELSRLVVYCQAVSFAKNTSGRITEMSSFSEGEMISYCSREKIAEMLKYNTRQLCRVYPGLLRWNSSNFDPIPMWKMGCQLVALNYQRPDQHQQHNNALFLRNGRCGYVLKPDCFKAENFSPFDASSFSMVEPMSIQLKILCGRNLFGGHSSPVSNPFVSIEIVGLEFDTQKVRTSDKSLSKGSNSLSPVWKKQEFIFDITFPDLAFLRFELLDDSFEKSKAALAQATYPVKGIREGYRSVHLYNNHSEKLELSSLLVHVKLKPLDEAKERNKLKLIGGMALSSFSGSVKKSS